MAVPVPKIVITDDSSPASSQWSSSAPSPRETPRGGNRVKIRSRTMGNQRNPLGREPAVSGFARQGNKVKTAVTPREMSTTPRPAAATTTTRASSSMPRVPRKDSNPQAARRDSNPQAAANTGVSTMGGGPKVRSPFVGSSKENGARDRNGGAGGGPKKFFQTATPSRAAMRNPRAPIVPPAPPPEPPRREMTVHVAYRSPSPSRPSTACSRSTAWAAPVAKPELRDDAGLGDVKADTQPKRKRGDKKKGRKVKAELKLEDLTIEDMLRYEMESSSDEDDDEDDDSAIESDAESRGSTIDTDLELECEVKKDAGRENIYLKACALFRVTPCQHFIRQMELTNIDLRNAQLCMEGLKAICIALLTNITVTRLNLSGNRVGAKGAGYLGELLQENVYISTLKVARCELEEEAMGVLMDCLSTNFTIRHLDLSGNPLPGAHILPVAQYIKNNEVLLALRLSGNSIDEVGGQILGPAIGANTAIKRLDLSWNHLRLRGAEAVCEALLYNSTLELMNLAWNGLGQEGTRALELPLLRNQTLLELDLTSNRLDIHCLRPVLAAITKNATLQTLKLGHNPLTTESAKTILATLETSSRTGLRELDLSDVVIDDEFVRQVERVQQTCTLHVTYGDILHKPTFDLGRVEPMNMFDPLLVLFEYMRQRNYRVIDLFRDLDTDHSNTLSKKEIAELFKQLQLPVSDGLIDELMRKVDLDKNKEIDIEEMKIAQKKTTRKLLMKRAKLLQAGKTPRRPSTPVLQVNPASPDGLSRPSSPLGAFPGLMRRETSLSSEGLNRPISPQGVFPGLRRRETPLTPEGYGRPTSPSPGPRRRDTPLSPALGSSRRESVDDSAVPAIAVPVLKKPMPRLKSAK